MCNEILPENVNLILDDFERALCLPILLGIIYFTAVLAIPLATSIYSTAQGYLDSGSGSRKKSSCKRKSFMDKMKGEQYQYKIWRRNVKIREKNLQLLLTFSFSSLSHRHHRLVAVLKLPIVCKVRLGGLVIFDAKFCRIRLWRWRRRRWLTIRPYRAV